MQTLSQLRKNLEKYISSEFKYMVTFPYNIPAGNTAAFEDEFKILDITLDSRKVKKGSMFCCVVGALSDGHDYIEAAIEKGALIILSENEPEKQYDDVLVISVGKGNMNKSLGYFASAFYNNPSDKLRCIGITGTNGKTTTASLVHQLLNSLGEKSALITTTQETDIEKGLFNTVRTTPDALEIQKILSQCVENNLKSVVMEVSSHAVALGRIVGIDFDAAAFTNLSHDHLDFHKTFDEYRSAKKTFFNDLSQGAHAISNQDDTYGKTMLENTKAKEVFYSVQKDISEINLEVGHTSFVLSCEEGEVNFKTSLLGYFNIENTLCAIEVAQKSGYSYQEVSWHTKKLVAPKGRFERVENGGVYGVIDYAHTPDAVIKILQATRALMSTEQKLYCVVGCGGDRDRLKRPIMAAAALDNADYVFFTSDNPRTEDPEQIKTDILSNVLHDKEFDGKWEYIFDRKEAIEAALEKANKGDVIVMAGKGHEEYQEMKDGKVFFSEKGVFEDYKFG